MDGSGDDKSTHGPPPRRSLPRRARESIVIEGHALYATARRAGLAAPIAGAVGGVLGVLLTGAFVYAAGPDYGALAHRLQRLERSADAKTSDAQVLAERLSAVEAALAATPPAAAAKLAQRLDALEAADRAAAVQRAALAQRLSLAEAVSADASPRIAALEARPSAQGLVAIKTSLAAQAEALAHLQAAQPDPHLAEDLANRIVALEAARAVGSLASAREPLQADLARLDQALAAQRVEVEALRDRLAKLETAWRAPKGDTHAGPSNAARAIAALALQLRLHAGQPLGEAIAALDRLGVDPAALAPLRPYAERGAPSLSQLNHAFGEIAPRLAPVSTRLWDSVFGLVQVRKLGESREADVEGGVVQVEAALATGDLAAALNAMPIPPPAAQDAAKAWMDKVASRLAATKAAAELARRAFADLGAR